MLSAPIGMTGEALLTRVRTSSNYPTSPMQPIDIALALFSPAEFELQALSCDLR
jgi:hypothetical protein